MDLINVFNLKIVIEETAQSITHLSCKHKDLGVDP